MMHYQMAIGELVNYVYIGLDASEGTVCKINFILTHFEGIVYVDSIVDLQYRRLTVVPSDPGSNAESFRSFISPHCPKLGHHKGVKYLLIKTKHPQHCRNWGAGRCGERRRSRLNGLMRLSSRNFSCVRLPLTFCLAQEPSASFFTFLQLR